MTSDGINVSEHIDLSPFSTNFIKLLTKNGEGMVKKILRTEFLKNNFPLAKKL